MFPSLGENRREALKIAASFRGEEAFEAGRRRGGGARHGAPVAFRGALHRARARVPRAVLLGSARRR